MEQGIVAINPLMPYEDIQADKLSLPVLGLGIGALASDIAQKTKILNRTTDTPSGKVFAPTGETIESNQIPGMAPAEELQGLPGLLGIEPDKQVEGMSPVSPPTKDKGFTTPVSEDMKILYNVEDGKPKYKYPTEEEIKKFINEENEFWEQNQQRANEKYPELSSNNLPKMVEADKHFGAAAHSFQNFKNSKLIYMSPDEYLNLTKGFRPTDGEEQLGSTMKVKNIESLLQEGKELANIPMLYVKKVGDEFVVKGQEGNHRAKAFKNLGYDKIPVVIEGNTREEREATKDFFPTSIQSKEGEMVLTKPEDFYSVIDKKPLFTKEQPTESKYTLSRELDPKLLDEMLMTRGGVKGFQESMKGGMAPLPPSTKRQMFIQYNDKIMNKYGFDKTDTDPETMSPDELKKLQQKYFTKQDAIDYIVSAAYDVIGGQTKQPGKETIFALDDEGLPIAAVKMGLGNLVGKGRIEGIAIKEAGSLFPEAFDMVIEEAKKVAKENGKKFLVAEDLTSDAAYNAFKKRGFKPVTNKKFDMFEGKLVYRPGGGRKVKQKNLVFELEPIEKKAKGGIIDKPLLGGNRYI